MKINLFKCLEINLFSIHSHVHQCEGGDYKKKKKTDCTLHFLPHSKWQKDSFYKD